MVKEETTYIVSHKPDAYYLEYEREEFDDIVQAFNLVRKLQEDEELFFLFKRKGGKKEYEEVLMWPGSGI